VRHISYDAIAAAYDRRYVNEDYSGIERALLEFIGTASQQVLEVGCGTGHWLQLLNSRNLVATGIDLSWGMLSSARAKLTTRRLTQGCAEHLPFNSPNFDRVFCVNAHHHFANKPHFFAEARRVLRPGGLLMTIALDPHTGTDQWWVYDYFDGTLAIDKERYPSCEQIRDWMGNAGFTDTYSFEVQHEPGQVAAQAALQNGMITPAYTSQLAVLSREEFSEGLERIEAALAKDKSLRLCADLRLYAQAIATDQWSSHQIRPRHPQQSFLASVPAPRRVEVPRWPLA
jgi:SAM-dependent methyltransferase